MAAAKIERTRINSDDKNGCASRVVWMNGGMMSLTELSKRVKKRKDLMMMMVMKEDKKEVAWWRCNVVV
jgi:hypothetical protein